MKLHPKAIIYSLLIDPLLSGLRKTVAEEIYGSDRVIDIACGPEATITVISGTICRGVG